MAGCLAVIKACSAAVTKLSLRVEVLGDTRLAAVKPQALLVLLKKECAIRERLQAADAPQARDLQKTAMLHPVPNSRPFSLLALLAVQAGKNSAALPAARFSAPSLDRYVSLQQICLRGPWDRVGCSADESSGKKATNLVQQ